MTPAPRRAGSIGPEQPYRMRILVSDTLSAAGLEILRAPGFEVHERLDLAPAQLADAIGGYDALIVRSRTRVTADIIARAARPKVARLSIRPPSTG